MVREFVPPTTIVAVSRLAPHLRCKLGLGAMAVVDE